MSGLAVCGEGKRREKRIFFGNTKTHTQRNMTESLYFHALRSVPGIGAKTLISLVERFGSAEAIWHATESELTDSKLIGPKSLASLFEARRSFSFEHERASLEKENITLLSFTNPAYPKLLREIPDFPPLLYVRGDFSGWNEKHFLTIIGSRKFTRYGKAVAEKFASDAVRVGFVVSSGLAFGIDAIAHTAALDSNGETVAVLGSGINDTHITPQTNLALAKRLMTRGALISEYPPGTEANKGTFPARNRIMAGLSFGTLVVEAADKSGTLITARLALEYNRDVFAIPGSIFSPLSIGCHKLLREGAKFTGSIEDILEECISFLPKQSNSSEEKLLPDNLTHNELRIVRHLSHEPLHIDNLVKLSTLDTADILATLTLLELKGLAKNIGGQQYIRIT